MASRQSKDKSPSTDNPIVKKEHVFPLEIVNYFTPLGTIPKPNYSSVLASSYDPYALTLVNQLVKIVFPKTSYTSQYVKKQCVQNLFSIESNRVLIIDPFRLATNYFPPRFHRIPKHCEKDVQYYSDILRHEKSITIKAIIDKTNTTKIIYHSDILTHHWYVKWGDKFPHTQAIVNNVTRDFPSPNILPVRARATVQMTELANAPASTFATTTKSSTNPKKKDSPLKEIHKDPDALYALLKNLIKEEEAAANHDSKDEWSSEASVTKNQYYPYNQEWFGHDEEDIPNLAED